jgi:hypothetical protein
VTRRDFFKVLSATSLGAALAHTPLEKIFAQQTGDKKPGTNVKDALHYPRTAASLPGKFPGKVVHVSHPKCIADGVIAGAAVSEMLRRGMLSLTGAKDIKDAWRMVVSPNDKIGLKVNPVAGPTLSTSHEIVRAIIDALQSAGIPRKNILIWDRREFELHEAGFTTENFPGIPCIGTERKDAKGSFYDEKGKLYGEEMIDTEWSYCAEVEEHYDAETIPYMVNEGQYSYFTKIVTKQVDKIINIPILKNAGPTITLCLKNLAYGSISNTGRLHKQLWAETCAEVCAFPPIRDKVVLNIADGIKGCYDGGPGANPQFITEFKSLLLGTDPVAVDRVGYEILLNRRKQEKVQKEESPKARIFLEIAQNLELGVADLAKIDLKKIDLA